jgi:hypothetical protein
MISKLHSQKSLFVVHLILKERERDLCTVDSSTGRVDAAVVLNSPGLDGLPDLLNVAGRGALQLVLDALGLEASLGRGSSGVGGGVGARGDGAGVEDGVGLVHLLVVLLERLPCLLDVAG